MKKQILAIIVAILLLIGCTPLIENKTLSLAQTPNAQAASTATVTPSPINVKTIMPTSTPHPTSTATPQPLALLGYKIGIDPGHQRHENNDMESVSPYYQKDKIKVSGGTKGIFSGVREYEFNLQFALELKTALKAQGAEVFMTRTEHRVDISNKERAQMVNEAACDIWIRIHANSSKDVNKNGISMLTPKQGSISTSLYVKSRLLSALIQKNVIAQTNAFDHGLSYRSTITGFNWSRIPVTLIECGYMSNENDDMLLQDETYRHKIVDGITDGMIQYFSDTTFPPEYEDNP